VSNDARLPTRRDMLIGAIASATLMRVRPLADQTRQPLTPIDFKAPAGACDCHTHIYGDPAKFPFFAGRVYTPETALPEELAALHKALGIQRVVIVTPSVYGTDNSATLYGMRARGRDARGVAVIDDKTGESELNALDKAGVCGIRLNLATAGISDPTIGRERLTWAVDRLARRNWHIQINTNLAMIAAIKDLVSVSPIPVVFDHFGGAQADLGVQQPGFAELLQLIESGKAYVKISAAYRISKLTDYADVVPLAKAFIAANRDRVLWGTDWPHPNPVTPPDRKPTDITPALRIDDGRLLNQLPVWAPDPEVRRMILVENPARLYKFPPSRKPTP